MFVQLMNDWEKSLKEKKDKVTYLQKVHSVLMEIKEADSLLKNSIVEEIEIDQRGINIVLNEEYQNIKMFINEHDYEEVPMSVLCFGNYEKDETDMVCRMLSFYQEEPFTVLDVGANVGWYVLNILKRFNNSTVYSFEPSPITYERLLHNLRLNDLTDQNSFNLGFYKENDKLDFYYDNEGSGASSLVNLRDKGSVEKISVRMEKMDDWVRKNAVSRIDFIKCDVEGAELFVYQGGIESIKKYKPIIFSEMLRKWSAKFNYHPNDIICLLKEIGYDCFVLAGSNKLKRFDHVDEETIETNYFFLHPEVHSKLIESLCVE